MVGSNLDIKCGKVNNHVLFCDGNCKGVGVWVRQPKSQKREK